MVLFHPKWEIAISNNAGSIDEAAAKTHGAQADTNLAGYQSGIGDYMSNVNSAIAAGNPFKSKDYLTSQNIATSGAMNSANDAAKQQQQQTVARTGTNSAALANTVGSQARTGQRDLTNYNATRDTANENSWLSQQDKLLSDQLAGTNSQEQAYATGVGAQSSNLSNMTSAMNANQAAQFGVLDSALAAGGAVGGGFAGCPAHGSLYLMADGTEMRAENLKVGDRIGGIDNEGQVIEEIQTAHCPVLRVITDDGFVARNSYVHAFALPYGGFVEAAKALCKSIRTAKGRGKVISVEPDGEDTVFNVITGGSHTYRADGVWALGMGEAERCVSMMTWGTIGDRLALELQEK